MSLQRIKELMINHSMEADKSIKYITVDYSGSGDSGCIDSPHYYTKNTGSLNYTEAKEFQVKHTPSELTELIDDYIISKVNPNFNNDGSSGNSTFEINNEGELIFSCDHSEYYTESTDLHFEEKL